MFSSNLAYKWGKTLWCVVRGDTIQLYCQFFTEMNVASSNSVQEAHKLDVQMTYAA